MQEQHDALLLDGRGVDAGVVEGVGLNGVGPGGRVGGRVAAVIDVIVQLCLDCGQVCFVRLQMVWRGKEGLSKKRATRAGSAVDSS